MGEPIRTDQHSAQSLIVYRGSSIIERRSSFGLDTEGQPHPLNFHAWDALVAIAIRKCLKYARSSSIYVMSDNKEC